MISCHCIMLTSTFSGLSFCLNITQIFHQTRLCQKSLKTNRLLVPRTKLKWMVFFFLQRSCNWLTLLFALSYLRPQSQLRQEINVLEKTSMVDASSFTRFWEFVMGSTSLFYKVGNWGNCLPFLPWLLHITLWRESFLLCLKFTMSSITHSFVTKSKVRIIMFSDKKN